MDNKRKHILLEKAYRYADPRRVEDPKDFVFNEKKGYWIGNDGTPMISSPYANCGETKKCDIETGEDQKGE